MIKGVIPGYSSRSKCQSKDLLQPMQNISKFLTLGTAYITWNKSCIHKSIGTWKQFPASFHLRLRNFIDTWRIIFHSGCQVYLRSSLIFEEALHRGGLLHPLSRVGIKAEDAMQSLRSVDCQGSISTTRHRSGKLPDLIQFVERKLF